MINMELAKQRNISQENIEAINALHELLERLISSYTLDVHYQEARDLVRSANMTLSNLWNFTYDERFDQWTPRFEQRWMELTWLGKTYECQDTGQRRTIQKEEVYQGNFIRIGNCYLDLGRAGAYHRVIGNLVEVFPVKNQCDGCQAGVPLNDGCHRMGKLGGYSDSMRCQADKYKGEYE